MNNHLKTIRHHTTGKLHNHLRSRLRWYDAWHNHPLHRHVHIATLVMFIVGIVTFSAVSFIPTRTYATDYTVSTNSTWCDAGDIPASIGNLTINVDVTLTIGGQTGNAVNGLNTGGTDACSFDSSGITITGTGTLTVSGNIVVAGEYTTGTDGVGHTFNFANVTVDSGKSISANGKGYAMATGTGAGTSGCYAAGGGGYGGAGGSGNGPPYRAGGSSYGSAINPVDLGSGGGDGGSTGSNGGAGGGSIKIIASGTISIAGSITANGSDGGTAPPNTCGLSGPGGGPGSGGSIYLQAGTIAGSGSITANGGAGTGNYQAGGGGGGRIVRFYTAADTFSGTKTASGGTGYASGSAGTESTYSIPVSPALSAPDNASGQPTTAIAFTFSSTNADTYNIQYDIQIDNNSDFSSITEEGDQTSAQTGYSLQDRGASGAGAGSTYYASGTTATYTLQGTLTSNTTYSWRVRSKAPGGSNTWSDWSLTRTIITNDPPVVSITNSPSQDSSGNIAIIYNICDTNHSSLTVNIQYTVNNSTYTTAQSGALSGTNSYGSVTGVSSNCGSPSSKSVTFDPSADTNITATYYSLASGNFKVRIQAVDGIANGTINSTASSALEMDNVAPTTPTNSSPANASYTASGTPTLTGSSYTDDTTQASSTWILDDDSGFGSPTFTTTKSSGTLTQFVIGTDGGSSLTDSTYYFKVKYKDSKGNETPYSSSTSFIKDATAPTAPTTLSIYDTSTGGNYSHQLEWTTSTEVNFKNYLVKRSVDGGGYSTVSTITDVATRTYRDSGLSTSSTYSYKITTTDQADSTADTSVVSNTPGGPVLSNISSTASGAPTTNSATISWDTTEASSSELRVGTGTGVYTTVGTRGDVGASSTGHTTTVSNLNPSTTYYFVVRSRDATGMVTQSSESTFATAAIPTVSVGPTPTVSFDTATITWTTSGATNSSLDYGATNSYGLRAGDASDSATSHSVVVGKLTPGTLYHYRINSIDVSSNAVTTTDQTFTTTSKTTISSISSGTPSNSSATITFTSGSGVKKTFVDYGTTECAGAGATVTAVGKITAANQTSHSIVLPSLSTGTTYKFRVRTHEIDGVSGNVIEKIDDNSTSCYSFSTGTDSTVPVISEVASSGVTNLSAVVTWSTDEVATTALSLSTSNGFSYAGGTITVANSSANNQQHTVALSDLTRNTTYYYLVRSTDATGNTSTSSQGTFTTTGDATGPVISAQSVGSVGQTSAVVTWITDEPASSTVSLGTVAGTYSLSGGTDTKLDRNHRIELTGLTAGTSYYVQIASADTNSNSSTKNYGDDSTLTFTTQATPAVSAVTTGTPTSTTTTVSWTSNLDGDSFVEFGTTTAYGSRQGSTASTATHEVTLTGLTASTLYHYRVRSTDANGNLAVGADTTFATSTVTSSVSDAVAPAISAVGPNVSVGADSALITWVTDESANSIVRYGTTSAVAGETSIDDAVTSHSVTLKALAPSTTYSYRVRSKDSAGNVGQSEIKTFTTKAKSDISAVVISDITLTSAIVTWQTSRATTSVLSYGATTSYGSSVDDQSLGSTTKHTIKINDLAPSSNYHFKIQGVDDDAETISSDDYIFNTQTLPEISGLSITDVQANKATISWTTNVKTDAHIQYGESSASEHDQGTSDMSTTHTVILIGLNGQTDYSFVAQSRDVFGNSATSGARSFTTKKDTFPPEISQVKSEVSTVGRGEGSRIQVIVSWLTDEGSTSQVFYGTGVAGQDLGSQTTLDTSYNQNHVVIVRDLLPSTTYRFKVASKDNADNESLSSDFTLLTPEKQESALTIIVKSLEETFGFLGNIKELFK